MAVLPPRTRDLNPTFDSECVSHGTRRNARGVPRESLRKSHELIIAPPTARAKSRATAHIRTLQVKATDEHRLIFILALHPIHPVSVEATTDKLQRANRFSSLHLALHPTPRRWRQRLTANESAVSLNQNE